MTATTSFGTGAAIGGGAGFSAGFTNGLGNGLISGQDFGQALWSGTTSGLIGGASGGLIGGVAGGIDAASDGRNFWNGKYGEDHLLNRTYDVGIRQTNIESNSKSPYEKGLEGVNRAEQEITDQGGKVLTREVTL